MQSLKTLAAVLFTIVGAVAVADVPSTHGMLIFGAEKVYLSHLPMFHTPHDYQLLMEVELTPAAKAAFVEDQKSHPEKFYTLVPEEFVLPDMVASPRPFSADIVRGHFERPGRKTIIPETEVTITKIIHFRKLPPSAPKPAVSQYLLFGAPGEAFLAHFITGRPNFDHVMSATVTDATLLEGGAVQLSFAGNIDKEPLKKGASVPGVVADKSLYVEFGDLSH